MNKYKSIWFPVIVFLLGSVILVSWKDSPSPKYFIDLGKINQPPVISGFLKLGTHTDPSGNTVDANNLYFMRNGKPWFPVMGEFHFSRYPRGQWEESILKMKAGGIDIIATYVFWIYHEEQEGVFNWSGDRDLRYFISLCAKHGMKVWVRIGPWCHGEVRNGAFPDWLLKKAKVRTNDSSYLHYVKLYFSEINKQLKEYYFKEGGTVIGTQIENEFRFNNPKGLAHMMTLKKMAVDAGIDVPYYTATGWPGSNLKQNELLPVWGAYPEAPWDHKTTQLPLSPNYLFGALRNDPAIGADLLGKQDDQSAANAGFPYPFATAELGSGNEVTYHRRPIIEADDVTALAYVKLGSGANLLGYYMYHGGSDKIGKLSTLQESQVTGYPNDYPLISYDFYSPVGEWGQLRPSYRKYKSLHLFLNDFGDILAPLYPVFPEHETVLPATTDTLRWSVRAKDNSGFIFINNFQRQLTMHAIRDVRLDLKLKTGTVLHVPELPVTIPKDAQIIWPFNLTLSGGALLTYATSQLLCKLDNKDRMSYLFFAPAGIAPEYLFANDKIKSLTASHAIVVKRTDGYKITSLQPGASCVINIELTNGGKISLLTLTNQEALDSWKSVIGGKERLFISSSDLIFTENKVRIQSTGNTAIRFSVYPATTDLYVNNTKGVVAEKDGLFETYHFSLPEKKIKVAIENEPDNQGSSVTPIEKIMELQKGKAVKYPNTLQRPGPQYGTRFTAVKGFPSWKVSIPSDALTGLSDAFIKIDYTGDTGEAYAEGRLIADDFYAGLPMTIGLKRFAKLLPGKSFQFQVVPLTDERAIFFEKGTREPLKGKTVAELKRVEIIPQYEVIINLGK